jgi:hypothetical protein
VGGPTIVAYDIFFFFFFFLRPIRAKKCLKKAK